MAAVYRDTENGIASGSRENVEPKIAQYHPKSQVYASVVLFLFINCLKPEIHVNVICKLFPDSLIQ
jgi:hypothetical protein